MSWVDWMFRTSIVFAYVSALYFVMSDHTVVVGLVQFMIAAGMTGILVKEELK